jgi:Tol biopolymer transport system component
MHDVAEELRWIGAAGSQAGVAAPPTMRRKTRERLAWVTAAAALLGLAVTGALALRGRVPPAVYSFTIPRADAGYVSSGLAKVSPDGQWFCFSARPAEGKPPKLFVRSASSFDVRALDGTEKADDFQWGLDGRSIVFVADGKIRVVEVTGGSPRTVAESSDAGSLAMNREGVVLAGSGTAGIWRFAARGGAGERITTPDKGRHEIWHGFPVFLPDGKRFLYISFVRDPSKREQPHYLHAGSLDSRETKFIGEIGSRVAYAPPGYLLSIKDGTLMSVRFDADRLEIHGEPEPLADAVSYFKPTGHADFSASANGTVTYRAPFGGESLVWVDRTGHRTGALPVTGDFSSVRLSGDGASVVAGLVDPRIGTTDLWLYGARRETATRLTFSAGYEDAPTLTPDGARLFYGSDALGVPDIFVKQMGSAEDDRPFLVAPGFQYPLDVSPDGKWLVYMWADYGDTREDLYVTPLEGDPRPIPFVRTPASERVARFSPDGTAVAYTSNESGAFQVYVKAFPGPGQARQVSTRGGGDPVWSHDGRHLYFLHLNGVYEADVRAPDAEPRLLFETARPLGALEVSPDGTRHLVITVDELATQTPTRVVVNWPALLKNGKR